MINSLEDGLSIRDHKKEIGHFPLLVSPTTQEIMAFGGRVMAGLIPSTIGSIGSLFSFYYRKKKRDIKLVSEKSRPVLIELIRSEDALEKTGNFFLLVALSSILFETEMEICLCTRIKPIAKELVEAIERHKSNFNTEVLEAWIENKTETTLAIIVMLLHSIRWAVQENNEQIKSHIVCLFKDQFIDIVSQKSFALAVNEIREEYRNPAIHGRKTEFTYLEYARLARLIIGEESFRSWVSSTKNSFQVDSGVLHDHLLLAKNYP